MEYDLPKLANPNATVDLKLLSGGYLYLPMNFFVRESPPDDIRKVPSMSWLIQHRDSGTNLIFDLGLRKDTQGYTPAVQRRLQTLIKAEVPRDVFDDLEQCCTDPHSDIDTVIFSHLHYDHIGNPAKLGPKTKFLIGPGARGLLSESASYPSVAESHYDSNLLPRERTTELPNSEDRDFWSSLGSFPDAHDYFKDGSLFVINAPGHCPGHINLLVRTDETHWILLAGDTAHSSGLLSGICTTAEFIDEATGILTCAHHNRQLAEEHQERVRQIGRLPNVEVILAHDEEKYESLRGHFKLGTCTAH